MIQVDKLTKYYHDFCAVEEISLEVKKGEILGLLGPNGAGKTTTLRMLTGFYKPTSGKIKIQDFSIDENPLEIKKMIGYLPESAPLYNDMLVYDYLYYIASIRGLDKTSTKNEIEKLVDLCGLQGIMHKNINDLSKGLKQRVGLAHAMMDNPEILILDEPTSGLDPNQIVEIRNIIRKIGKEKTIIFSTHILSEAEATCDRIVIINKGKIVADGSTEEIKQRSANTNTLNLSLTGAGFQETKDVFQSLDGISEIKETQTGSSETADLQIIYDASLDLRESVYTKIKENDWGLMEFYQETKSLENIFRELTREN